MRAAVTSAPGRIAVETVADPEPGPGDAVLDAGAVVPARAPARVQVAR